MKKDKEWLKEAVGELDLVNTVFEPDGVSYIDTAVSVMQVYDLIDQLEDSEKLEGSDKVVIPKFVADWWERDDDSVTMYEGVRIEKKHKLDLVSYFQDRGLIDSLSKVEVWLDENDSIFLDLVNGKPYEVEEEQRYYVELIAGGYLEYYPRSGNYGITGYKEGNHGLTKLTEERIKSLPKGDVLFKHFAAPVEKVAE